MDAREWEEFLNGLPHPVLETIGVYLSDQDGTNLGHVLPRFEPKEYVISFECVVNTDKFEAKQHNVLEVYKKWIENRRGYRNKVILGPCYIQKEETRVDLREKIIDYIITYWPNIQHLHIQNDEMMLNAESCTKLLNLSKLKTLTATNIKFRLPKNQRVWPHLETLNLQGPQYYDPDMPNIATLPQLTTLVIDDIIIGDIQFIVGFIVKLFSNANIHTIRISTHHKQDLDSLQTQSIVHAIPEHTQLSTRNIMPSKADYVNTRWTLTED